MNRIKIVGNTQVGSDSIEHLIGVEFPVHSIHADEVIVIHEGSKMPLCQEEYEFID